MTDHEKRMQSDLPRPGDDDFAGTAGRMLRESANDLDATSAARLNRSRQAALAELREPRAGRAWLMPALSTAAVGVVAIALWLGRGTVPAGTAPPVPAIESAADMDLLLAGDNLEMLEDLDFYAWLDADLSDDELRAELESAS